ncbi:MAG TPA: hypothetical protein VFB16_13060 [Bauldia sp.]|nr:hypothetical protein [Bauldia sp.]
MATRSSRRSPVRRPPRRRPFRASSRVAFSDARIIESGAKPPLDDDEGNYA